MTIDLHDKELIERINAHEEAAIETVFHRFYAALCFFGNKITHDQEASKDIVQEVFARLFEKKHYRYENMIMLKTFLYNSVRNGAIDYIRLQEKSSKAIRNNQPAPTVNDIDIDYFEIESDVISKIFEAIDRLPEACRTIFKMSYLDRMSVLEIATTLNIAESTVKTQRQRAKHHLRSWLRDLYSTVILMFF